MREYHILNLGAGVQSTALYLMDLDLELEHQFDCAIFADTGDEPAATEEKRRADRRARGSNDAMKSTTYHPTGIVGSRFNLRISA